MDSIIGAGVAGGDAEGQLVALCSRSMAFDDLARTRRRRAGRLLASSKPSREMAGTKFFTRSISSWQNSSSIRVALVKLTGKSQSVCFSHKADQVLLAHQRLAAGVDVHVDAQFLALR